ncbi:LacI family DNA-binding transcriptional regulator [Azospirillum canadense]|uniref:LacI family DNA-binding transcriptional regulator n=1 Tax=Azospirillum canadense TaxID=403962 RepID=UPI002227BE04|nr:LacI family DNA-binding transcriptional regulator [Azospirillum canadense]MCW2244317.1 LacI family gluconate utilization system Gnt-I transcriptional repressor [Azospirillum canadense]
MSDTPTLPPRRGAAKKGTEPAKAAAKAAGTRGTRPSSGRVTLEDVAKLAGVSMMSVSRVVNRPESVTPEIREIVRKAISETGYVPNLLAGGLASSKTKLVAAVVPTLTHVMFSHAIQSFSDRLAADGYQMLLGLSSYPTEREDSLVHAILSRRPDALYLTGTSHSAETRRQLRAAKIPIVETWDLSHKPIDMAVGFSHRAVGERLGEYLYGKGYRRIAVISADDERAMIRRDGVVSALAKLGVTDVTTVPTPAPSSLSMGRKVLGELVDQGFRGAIHASSDAMAHGVLLEAQARGLSVPQDIAVIGFGDLDFAAYTSPPLSTVRVDRFTVGRLAAEMLLKRLAGDPVSPKVVDVGFDIVERATS